MDAELLARLGRVRMLGLAGAPGAGKSTLAARLAAAVRGAVVVPMDGFHLSTARLRELGRVERRGAPDTFDAAGYVELLISVRRRDVTVRAPDFDRAAEEPLPGAIEIAPDAPLVITEGNYLLLAEAPWARVRPQLDEVWFVQVPEPVRTKRLIARFVAFGMDVDTATARVLTGSDSDNAALVAETRARADRIVGPADWDDG